MRTWILAALFVIATPGAARADFGLGVFIGEPLGLDVKIDIARRQALDIVLGVVSIRNGLRDDSYGHLTYLVTPLVGRGDTLLLPIRLGIGVAAFGVVEENVGVAGRVPLQIGLIFRNAPIEIYGEVALRVNFVQANEADVTVELDGGLGLRFLF